MTKLDKLWLMLQWALTHIQLNTTLSFKKIRWIWQYVKYALKNYLPLILLSAAISQTFAIYNFHNYSQQKCRNVILFWILHRIIESPGLKRTTMITWFQSPCYVQGRQPPDQAAQSHIQPGLKFVQGWGIHNLPGQPVPVCHHPLSEKLPPTV